MDVTTTRVSELEPKLQRLYDSARTAVAAQDYERGRELLELLVREQPAFEEAYRVLFAVLSRADSCRKPACGCLPWVKVQTKGRKLLRSKTPLAALSYATHLLGVHPGSRAVLHYACRAAAVAGFDALSTETAELCSRIYPNDVPTLRLLADRYSGSGNEKNLVATLQQLRAVRPNDSILTTALKQATAAAAIKDAHWDEARSFRDVVRDVDQAKVLEKQLRLSPDDTETLAILLEDAMDKAEENPTPATQRAVGDLHMRMGDPDRALEVYEAAFELSGSMDPGLDDCIARAQMKQFDLSVQKWERYRSDNPDRAHLADQRILALRDEQRSVLQIRLQERVARYPTELNYRFDLGKLLFETGDCDGALKQLQAAQRSPKLRPHALVVIARCLVETGMLSLAAEQFESAVRLGKHFTQEQMLEALYHWADVKERLGERKDALRLYKRIYATDVTFRDVSGRLQNLLKSARGAHVDEPENGTHGGDTPP